jgi:hypothetical protein
MFRIAHSLTLAFERAGFGGLEAQVAEETEKRNRDLRLLSRVLGFRVIIEVSDENHHL